jgi:hypothetical protein
MGNQFNFDQQPDETPEAWLARLQVASPEGLNMDQRFSHQHRKERAERLVKGAQKCSKPMHKAEMLPQTKGPDGEPGLLLSRRSRLCAVIWVLLFRLPGRPPQRWRR